MKAVNTVLKVLAALAAVAGVVYVVATYGDKIVAWAKKLISSCPCKCGCTDDAEEIAEELPTEEAPAADAPAEEAPAEEVPVEDGAVVASETDFEG